MRRPAWGALLLVVATLAAGTARSGCMPQKRAEVPLLLRDGFPIVPATIDGVPAMMLLDTGAQGMLVTPGAVRSLRLQADQGRTTRLLGTGGSRDVPNVVLRRLQIGGAMLPDASAPVASLPGVPQTEPLLAGLLGAPLLAAYDLDLDTLRGRLGLYDSRACGDALPPVPPPFTVVPIEVSPEGEAFIAVQVNGESLLAIIDTGSRATILTERAALRLGLGGPASANLARGVDGVAVQVRHARVRSLQVGQDRILDAPVSIAPLQLGRGDLLLGMDYLGRRRVWISYGTGRVVLGRAMPE